MSACSSVPPAPSAKFVQRRVFGALADAHVVLLRQKPGCHAGVHLPSFAYLAMPSLHN